MSHDDFEFEPMPGIPARLPKDEHLLWQGSPDWKSLAVRAYHVRKVAGYFALLAAWRLAVGLQAGHAAGDIAASCGFLLVLGCVAIGVLGLLAYLNARSTIYSVTSRRVLLRHGVAVPLTMNIPLKHIDDASLRTFKDGTGDIALRLPKNERIGYLITWPHLRPGMFTHPQPSLRALANSTAAADILAAALAADAGMPASRLTASAAGTSAPGTRIRGTDPVAAGPLHAEPRNAAAA